MPTFFFYNNLTNPSILSKISPQFDCADGYAMVQEYDPVMPYICVNEVCAKALTNTKPIPSNPLRCILIRVSPGARLLFINWLSWYLEGTRREYLEGTRWSKDPHNWFCRHSWHRSEGCTRVACFFPRRLGWLVWFGVCRQYFYWWCLHWDEEGAPHWRRVLVSHRSNCLVCIWLLRIWRGLITQGRKSLLLDIGGYAR